MKICLNNQIVEINKPMKIIDLFDNKGYNYYAANVNNRLRELNYLITNDCEIQLLDLNSSAVVKMYQSTLRYVIVMAAKRVYPKVKLVFNYSVSRSIFASVSNLGHPFLQDDLNKISLELHNIISADIPINRFNVSKEEAINFYKNEGFNDKIKVLKYRKEDIVHMYECAEYKNYMYGYMLPSTGYLKDFILRLYNPGFLISYPRAENMGKIPKFNDEKVFRRILKEANQWSDLTKSSYINQINDIIEDGNALEFINICEANHNRQLADLGDKISSNISNIKLIAVAGPSSSGKTTFTNRLRIELKSRGIDPLMISIDDFYNHPDLAPLDAYGKPDFEHIEALDIKLFNDCIYNLIQGESVALPTYNFQTKQRSFKEPIVLKNNQVILIEGIHALNDELTPSIPSEFKFKVFIAPLTQIRIDDHNPISISDVRLIRRMVRDHQYRNTGCEKTLESWQSVRNGEFKWIYPFQNEADYVFNSILSYELCVLRKHAIPLLEAITEDSPHYIAANGLLKFLKVFKPISDKWIPCNSIIREFIGDSIFYTEDKE